MKQRMDKVVSYYTAYYKFRHILKSLDSVATTADRIQKEIKTTCSCLCGDLNQDLNQQPGSTKLPRSSKFSVNDDALDHSTTQAGGNEIK